MKIFERYIIGHLLRSFLLVLFLLVGLFSITTLLDEMGGIGIGRYQLSDALLFVARSAPHTMLELVPLTALLGGILALGKLDASNELVSLRAMGVTAWQIARSVQKAGLVLIVAALGIAQFVAPGTQKTADLERSLALHDSYASQSRSGFWFRDGTRFVEVPEVLPGHRLGDVTILDFDEAGRLSERTRARVARVVDSTSWILEDVRQETLTGTRVESRSAKTLPFQTTFDRSFLEVTSLRPESLSISELFAYVRSMRELGQVDEAFRLQLWRLLGLPLSTAGMLLLAVAFVLGLRHSSPGKRLLLGGVLGMFGYGLDRIGGYLGMLTGANGALTALLPGVAILVIAVVLMRWAR